MDMSFPDPNDRSINSPIVLIHPKELLSIYNWYQFSVYKANTTEDTINENIKSWAVSTAKYYKWKTIAFSGNQMILSMGTIEVV